MVSKELFFEEIKITDKNVKELDFVLNTIGIKSGALKKSHLLRRVRARMMRTSLRVFSDYLNFLQSNKDEQQKLRKAFSINVTRFFRDIELFKFLQRDVLPSIQTQKPQKMIKIWSAGCADGAEPYTLAILCKELDMNSSRVEIHATDFNQELLSAAQRGIYPKEYLSETPLEIQTKYFTNISPDQVKISPILQSYISFKLNNLTDDNIKLFPKYDLILCRNVLIYFSNEQKKKLILKFHKVLKSGGFLALGMTEILRFTTREGFNIHKGKYHVYVKS